MDHAAVAFEMAGDVLPLVGEAGNGFGGDWFFLFRMLFHARLYDLSPP